MIEETEKVYERCRFKKGKDGMDKVTAMKMVVEEYLIGEKLYAALVF